MSSDRAPSARFVRSSVDLPANQHASFRAWCGEAAVQLGRARVTTMDVVRALVRRLLSDETLARKIRDDLRDGCVLMTRFRRLTWAADRCGSGKFIAPACPVWINDVRQRAGDDPLDE